MSLDPKAFLAQFAAGAERLGARDLVRIRTLDTHTAGEPLRIVLDAPVLPQGDTVLARRRDAREAWDGLRRLLMFEPRGHPDMYGAIITPPVSEGALFGVLFMHNEGWSTMCGHAVIALAKVAVELGWTEAREPQTTVVMDTPAGLVTAHARVAAGRVTSAWFENVASFAPLLDGEVEVAGLGRVRFDLGFGGAFYAYVDADRLGIALDPDNATRLREAGMAIKHAVASHPAIRHPLEADLSFLYGTIFTGRARAPEAHSRHVCIFADGAIDRSPTGTGVAGRVAILHARGELETGVSAAFESITGGQFIGRAASSLDFHGHAAVIPEVEGTAFFTGRHEFLLEPGDPLREGFLVR